MSSQQYRLGRLTRTRTDGSKYWSWAIIIPDEAGGRERYSLGTTDRIRADKAANDFWQKRSLRSVGTIGDIVDGYLATLPSPYPGWNSTGDVTHNELRSKIRQAVRKRDGWKAARPYWGELSLNDVDEETSGEYLLWRGKAVNTMRNELNVVRSAMTWLKERKLGVTPPKIIVPAIPDSTVEHLTKAQFRTFIEGCKLPHVTLFAMLGVGTGGRKTAILEGKLDQVDWERCLLDLNPEGREQNKKGRATVPLGGRLMDKLREAREMNVTDYIIEYNGKPVVDIKTGINAASARSGIKAHPHMFRHSAAVWMAEDRTPMEEIAAFLGHTNVQITIRVYAKFHPDYLRRAAKSLDW